MAAAVDAVLLDVGGLLVLPHPDQVGPALGLDLDEEPAARAHYAGAAAMDGVGKGGWGAYLTAYAIEAGVPASRLRVVLPALGRAFAGEDGADVWSWILPEAADALRRLAAAGLRLAVVSNSDGTVEDRLRHSAVCQVGEGGGTRVSAVVDSRLVGVEKPDPAIFRHALQALEVDPGAAVHVGDTVHADVMGARAAGVRALHLDPFGFCPLDDHEHIASLEEVLGLAASRAPSPGG